MRSSGIRLASMLVATAGLAGMGQITHVGDPGQSATTPGAKQQPAERGGNVRQNSPMYAILEGRYPVASNRRRAGYGWTNKHAQRVAAKKRNVRRHRASVRG